MAVTKAPSLRAVGTGVAAAAVLIGAFALGVSRGTTSGDPSSAAGRLGSQSGVQLTSAAAAGARITVTGTGMVSGTAGLVAGWRARAGRDGAPRGRSSMAIRYLAGPCMSRRAARTAPNASSTTLESGASAAPPR